MVDALVAPVLSCCNPNMTWPGMTDPGLPNFTKACLLANLAGINFVLDFIPPTPQKIASLSPPSITLFLNGFMGGMTMPAKYPSVSLGPLTIPGVGEPPYERPLDPQLKFMAVGILLPYYLIQDMVTGLLNLQILIPTPGGIQTKFTELCVSAGIGGPDVGRFGGCLAAGIGDLFSSMIPV